MKTFILMTKLSSEMSSKLKQRKKVGRAWLEEVKKRKMT